MGYLEYYLSDNKFRKKEAMRIIEEFELDAYVIDGIVRWKSNNSIPPDDILALWVYVGKEFDYHASLSLSSEETSAFFNEYREKMKHHSPSPEEISEMRSVWGPGETIIDVITGKKIQL